MRSRVRTSLVALLGVCLLVGTAACTGSGQSDDSAQSTAGPQPAAESSPDGKGLPAVPEVVKEIEPSVVTIQTSAGLGSGIVYKSNGTIVTAAHVVENNREQPFKQVQVKFADGKTSPAQVVAVDNVTDIGVIKAKRDGLPVPKYADSLPEVGQMTVVVGSPMGLAGTATAGIVSALHRKMPPSQENPQGLIGLIQVDAPISPGNSGGAAVNGNAVVIGMSEAYLPPKSGAVAIGFVTPATTLTQVADELIAHGEANHAYLGVRPANISPQVAERLNLPVSTGVLIVEVVESSPAARAGLKSGDIITSFAGTEVDRVIDLLAALRKHDPGDQVELVVLRDDEKQTVNVDLGDRANLSS